MRKNIVYNQDFGAPPPPPPPGFNPPPPASQFSGGSMDGNASTNAIIALIAGILAWFFCPFILGIVAWIMGKGEINKINNGQSPAAGLTMAKIGMWLGIVNIIVCVLVGLLYVLIIVIAMLGVSN